MAFSRFIKTQRAEIWTFIKYALTGVFNTLITYIVFSGLVYIHVLPSYALAIGYLLGMISSYVVNSRWTFQPSIRHISYFKRFLVINLLVLVLSEITLHLILHRLHIAYIAQLINIIPMTVIGYLSNRYLVFTTESLSDIDLSTKLTQTKDLQRRSAKELFLFAVAIALAQRLWLTFYALLELLLHRQKITIYNLFLGYYKHWDSGWYLEIAKSGFTTLKQTAFWPLYPFFIRILHDVTGFSYTLSGVFISFLAFIFFLYYIGRIADTEFGTKTARASILLFAFFPTSYYFDAVYTESLFMVFCVFAVEQAMANRFWSAGILAGLATLTRNTGVFLDLILFFEYLRYRKMNLRFWTSTWWKRLNHQVFALTLPVLFLLFYMVYLKAHTGHLLAFLTAEKYWDRHYMPLWETYSFTWVKMLHSTGWYHEYDLVELTTVTLAIWMVILGMRYIRRSYRQFSWWLFTITVLWIAATEPSLNVHDYLVSFPRYILMLFPGFVYLAVTVVRLRATPLIILIFALGLGMLGNLFFHGIWIA
ncbi:GtrA family protein [Sulfoacidibacillus thermotolerans]|uniref:GtrA/DPMS transmembrane domain-containing protein n=1 Tax=Sulfoacidibacillus thermotolerans TaxID=1765684 RepID=A0A2U3DAU6_SULT2|nr:GtrA family protein [Sulfoacidibacillus thermotolerans]PWI58408.1 hypothetical protein BM613_04145 [Sulfoacidibacillus thermotolerans]